MASATSETNDMPALDGLGGAGGTAALPAGVSSGASPPSETSCGQIREAVRSPVDLLLQLDSSASMLEALPMAGATGSVATKWDAVRLALGNFVQDAANADVGFGVSYFPQVEEDVPYSCTTNADCLSAGPCSNSTCVQSLAETPAEGSPAVTFIASTSGQTCATDTECASGESCRTTSGTCLFPGLGAPALSVLPVCESNADCAGIPGTICEEIPPPLSSPTPWRSSSWMTAASLARSAAAMGPTTALAVVGAGSTSATPSVYQLGSSCAPRCVPRPATPRACSSGPAARNERRRRGA